MLYNQGSEPRRVTSSGRRERKDGDASSSGDETVKSDGRREAGSEREREKVFESNQIASKVFDDSWWQRRWLLILRLCGAFVMVDAGARLP
jgi:hypothetical protein